MNEQLSASSGFTLLEVITVCAIVGVLGLLAYPNMVRFQSQQQTKAGATQMAGVLDEARARATSEATPYLVFFNEETVDESGACGPTATMVRDSDRSYTITAGDDVRDIKLPADSCKKVQRVREDSTSGLPDLLLPLEDLSERAIGSAGLGGLGGGLGLGGEEEEESSGSGSGGSGSSGKGKGGSGSSGKSKAKSGKKTVTEARVTDAVVNGSTFPIDEASGRPVIAFSERGIPVDPTNPTNWGSGAGAIYLTDGNSVYAALVQPLGNVQLRMFDNASREWR